jgi:hypothetical protein
VKHYFRNESYALCQEAFQFLNDRCRKKQFTALSVCDRKYNRRRTVLNDDTLENVRLGLLQSPSKSLRKLSQQKNTSLGSAHKAVHLLHLRAYSIHAMPDLRPTDHAARLRYRNWFKAFVRNNIRVLDKTFFADEAWFHLSGYVNSQNDQLWSSENLHSYHESPLHAMKIGV